MTIESTRELELLRRTMELAEQSRARGDHPFGALLADPDGNILLEAMNTCGTRGDRTGHAERNLMTEASLKYDADFLAGCTMYTSAEPCAMCAGAVYWAGVGRVVHGMSEKALKELIGPDPENLTMDLPCRDVFAAGQRQVEVIGPLLAEESAKVHKGFWTPSPRNTSAKPVL
ncbi:nucleoside deaminase [Chelativorans xinjiangense]|uniref:nucleoside deaminase n=1 Tax=Chelativorans xinjiangense TaxID=2681485 RepID=UPI001359E61E|nr:nucleoside deaminase [Chelativorans xinjiangense]